MSGAASTAPPGGTIVAAVLLLAAAILLSSPPAQASPQANPQAPVRFNREVRPLLADRCFHCHGPDEHRRKAKLRLDRAAGDDGAYRVRKGVAAIQPGSLEGSAIWYRLTTKDPDEAMPPRESHKKALNAAEVDLIRRWILEGAEYEPHWAFLPPQPPPLPEASPGTDDAWSRAPIDRFVLRKLRATGLQPSPLADRRTLIRRATFDLTGLPPTRDEIATFLADGAADAYEHLVDRLLAKPQYGEHMARYWLDLVRFADTNGIHHDHYREMSPYRDWVIRAFNDNLPFDRFVVDQIAGDLHPEPTTDQLIASGFNRLHLIIDVGTALPEESLARNVTDRVTAIGTAFLGLTVQCAVCHDHKYDPIRQRDFYQLYAFFNNLDAAPETGGRSGTDFQRGLQDPYINLPSEAQAKQLAEAEARLHVADELVGFLKGAKEKAADEVQRKAVDDELARIDKERKQRVARRDAVVMAIPAAMVMKERADPRPAHVFLRGAYDRPGERVERDTPAFLPPLRPAGGDAPPTRMDLAQWLVAPQHPLTARVTVNRFWQQFFGTGLVETAEDFGTQGAWPSHPDLLDHLATSFVASGWDVKALVRRIVTSETYRQSAIAPTAAFARDPNNRLLARGSRFRMDAEMIRDQVLASSGLLNPTLYGKSVKPPQPDGIWEAVTLPSSFPRTYTPDTGDAIYRRSVYTFWKRALPPPQMSLFNAPTRESCTARRERTNTPLQALLLWNEREYLKAARHLAHETLRAGAKETATQRLTAVYETITSLLPDADETAALLATVKDLQAAYTEDPTLAQQLCEGLDLAPGVSPAELAAWTMVVSAIYNLDITKTHQ